MRRVGGSFASLKPGKGMHEPRGPYVEYTGVLPQDERGDAVPRIQSAVDSLMREGANVQVKHVPYDEVEAATGAPPYSWLPVGLPVRILFVGDDVGCPCGGTASHFALDSGFYSNFLQVHT